MEKNANRIVLESLIDTVYDSLEGYRKAHEIADAPHIKQAFADQLAKRQKTLDALNAQLVAVGGELVTKGTFTGALHRTWMSITDMFGTDDKTAVERVEEGEDYLANKFEEALEHTDLDMATRNAVQAAYAEIKEGERLADRLSATTEGAFGRT